MIRIISAVGNDSRTFANDRFKALFCMGYIGFIPAGYGDPDRLARPVTHQMQLRIQPAFGQPDGAPFASVFFTPFAAIRWVLTWVASSMSV